MSIPGLASPLVSPLEFRKITICPIHTCDLHSTPREPHETLSVKYLIWSSVGLLVILHQDYWQWGNATLDFGFLPRGLTFHVGISIGSAVVWLLATKYCWPEGLDEVSEDDKAEDTRA